MRVVDILDLCVILVSLLIEFVIRRIGAVALRFYPSRPMEEVAKYHRSTSELVSCAGYLVEDHHVQTADGYILVMQRILGRKDPLEKPQNGHMRSPNRPSNGQHLENGEKPVVFMLHGFMQNSEAWVCSNNSLAFILSDAGFDVWLGNIRGNKYSCKHVKYKWTDQQFWDFSLDQLIAHDVPTMVKYILHETKVEKLAYIGFSQGSAIGFGCFSVNATIASRISIFIALASTAKIKKLNPILEAVARSRPEIVFLMFGRKSFLSSTLLWRRFSGPHGFVKVCETGNRLMFGWLAKNIDPLEKPMLYSHLFSYASVKSLVHWFQIMRTGRFQMFDDTNQCTSPDTVYPGHELPAYPLDRIHCPVAVFFGGSDSLPDIESLLCDLPSTTIVHKEPTYEHLDFMWSKDAHLRVYPKIMELLKRSI